MAQKKPAISNGTNANAFYPSGFDWNINIPDTDLVTLIDEAIEKYGDKPCIDFLGTKYSYKEVGELINRAANGFRDRGITNGKRVGLFMPNTPFHAIMFFGALKAGATIVNFDSQYEAEALTRQIKDSGTEVMVTVDNPQFFPKIKGLVDNGTLSTAIMCPMDNALSGKLKVGYDVLNMCTVMKARLSAIFNKNVVSFGKFMANDNKTAFTAPNPEDLAVLQYTGGTTGVAKGAMLSHHNLAANAIQVENFIGVEQGEPNSDRMLLKGHDKMMAALPYFHVFGMTVTLVSGMRMGTELLIMPNPRDVKQLFETIHNKKPDLFPVVPRLLRAMLDYPDRKKYDISSLKVVMSGGAALPPDLKAEFEKTTGIPVIQGYGLTETSPVACVQHPLVKNDPNAVGFVVPQTEVMIADVNDQDKPVPLNEGETGEICIKGPQIMQGYWQKPDENKKVLQNGWFRTGDVGHISADGQVFITDRIKDMGLINGKNVYAVPIEKEILQNKDVVECNIVFVKDKSAGEAAMAFVRTRPGADLDEARLRQFFEDSGMSKYHKPKHIMFWPQDQELPKTNVGKPDKKELRVVAQRVLEERAAARPQGPKPPSIS